MDVRRLGVVAGLAALGVAGRFAFLWAPNVAPTYFVAFVAGAAYGAGTGAAVGALAMVASNLVLTGLHPAMLVNTPAMALVGAAGALVRPRWYEGPWRAAAAAYAGLLGVALLFVFSLVSDLADGALRLGLGEGVSDPRAYVALVLAGFAFNVIPAAVNGILFYAATGPTLRALGAAGLRPRRARPRAPQGTPAAPDARP